MSPSPCRILWAVVPLALVVGGCVLPGEIDPSVLNRYQQAMADRPEARRGGEKLQPYVPQPPVPPPPLAVLKDPKTGRNQIPLTLEQAVMRALANSVEIQLVSYDPAVAREEVVKAAADFDYVLFAKFNYEKQDKQTSSAVSGGMADIRTTQVGVKEKTVTGAEWSLAYTMVRTWDNTSSLFSTLSTRWEPTLVFEATQPLLRGAWPEYNLAQLRIAKIRHDASEQAFRQRVEEVVTELIDDYWKLIQARREQAIQQELLDKTIETENRIRERLRIDATEVELNQAQSAVAIRRAGLIQAEKIVGDAQDSLLRLLGDSQINAIAQQEILPVTEPSVAELRIDAADQLLAALQHNPVLEQARLAIAEAEVNVRIAKNETLPKLDFVGSAGLQGLSKALHEANENLGTLDYFNWAMGMEFEYPLGNRERLAELRSKRYTRLKAVAALQNTIDQLGVIINERVRKVYSSYRQMGAQRTAVEAAEVQLKALDATEKIRGKLSPAFLQTKLSAQETLAEAQRGLFAAIVDYNVALVELSRATGTVLELNNVKIGLPVATREKRWPGEPEEPPAKPGTKPSAKPAPGPVGPVPKPALGPAAKPVALPVPSPASRPDRQPAPQLPADQPQPKIISFRQVAPPPAAQPALRPVGPAHQPAPPPGPNAPPAEEKLPAPMPPKLLPEAQPSNPEAPRIIRFEQPRP